MKTIKYLLATVALMGGMVACNTDIEPVSVQNPYTYSDLYYQNLRDYKASDHSIAFGWFADYGPQNSLGVRFLGLPDSLDICSLWGGIPSADRTDIWEELRFVQKVKGTKMLVVAITRILAESDEHDFKQAWLAADELPYEEREAARMKAAEMYAEHFLDEIFLNDLDGFDADYEPEGDPLSGQYFRHFMDHLAKYMGPNPNITKEERLKLIQERYGKDVTDTDKLLCVDSNGQASSDLQDICNYYFVQAYGGGTSNYGWPYEKVVLCCNMGDNWQGNMAEMYEQASFQPSTGRKGGFGAFFIHRDYNVHENNPYPYKRFRECIQIQNPAVH